jgi:hypothetical protein
MDSFPRQTQCIVFTSSSRQPAKACAGSGSCEYEICTAPTADPTAVATADPTPKTTSEPIKKAISESTAEPTKNFGTNSGTN